MEKDILVTCPYNKAHRIRQYKLMNHIIKCKKQSSPGNMITCPLNSSHIVDRKNLSEHMASCSSVVSLIQDNAENEEVKTNVMPENLDVHKSTEDWDELPDVLPYDPMEASARKNVIRCVSGLTKSEKLKFKNDERKRLADINGIDKIKPSSSKNLNDEIPLRPPRGIAQAVLQDADKSDINISTQMYNSNRTIQEKSINDDILNMRHKKLYKPLEADTQADIQADNQEENSSNEKQFMENYRKTRSILIQKLKDLSLDINDASFNQSLSNLETIVKDHSKNLNSEEKTLPIFSQSQQRRNNEEM